MNPTRPYVMRCCQGLSIMLLEKLARDLNFNYHLYITADEQYGYVENGSWNGLVEDLTRGLAHMAVTALSITSSRSRVIDFTEPYFFSSFSILVREKPRETPIHAFMEPFHWSVWTIIACSATVRVHFLLCSIMYTYVNQY
jgi:ABC-type amino acid transport substrate-binding protein